MCIAIYSPGDKEPMSVSTFNESNKCNPDGMGLVYIGDDGHFRVMKTLDCPDVMYSEYVKANGLGHDCLLHFRKATHGRISNDNCHPFRHGRNEMYIHNGILSFHKAPDDEVDSRLFASRVLEHLPENWRDLPDITKMVEKFIVGSKIVILRSDGDVTILNEDSGHWKDDIWYSNRSYVVYTKSNSRDWKDDWGMYTGYSDGLTAGKYNHGGGEHCRNTTPDELVALTKLNVKHNGKVDTATGLPEVIFDYSYKAPLKHNELYEERSYGTFVLKTSSYMSKKGKKYITDKGKRSKHGAFWKALDANLDELPLTNDEEAHVADITIVGPSSDNDLSCNVPAGMVSTLDPYAEYYPHGFAYQGYDLCTHCMSDDLLLDAQTVPLFIEDDDGYLNCGACNVRITFDSPRKYTTTYNPSTCVPCTIGDIDADDANDMFDEFSDIGF